MDAWLPEGVHGREGSLVIPVRADGGPRLMGVLGVRCGHGKGGETRPIGEAPGQVFCSVVMGMFAVWTTSDRSEAERCGGHGRFGLGATAGPVHDQATR